MLTSLGPIGELVTSGKARAVKARTNTATGAGLFLEDLRYSMHVCMLIADSTLTRLSCTCRSLLQAMQTICLSLLILASPVLVLPKWSEFAEIINLPFYVYQSLCRARACLDLWVLSTGRPHHPCMSPHRRLTSTICNDQNPPNATCSELLNPSPMR